MAFIPGAKGYLSDSGDHILDLKNGLDFLNPKMDGIALLKKIGTNGDAAKSVKTEWTEVDLAPRSETITIDDSATTLTVADAYVYQIHDIIKIENEEVRVTALASATTLTIVRGYAGTTAAAHSSKLAFTMGSADPEGSDAPAGQADSAVRLYNYVQTFSKSVNLTTDEIAQLSTEGNPMTGQIERRFIELNRQLSRAVLYGVRYEDTTNKIHKLGGLKSFVTTNVTNVAGAMTVAAIDALILSIVNAGGNPDLLVVSPTQKQKLDALDANKQYLGKQEHTGGNLITTTWQSGILTTPLEVVVDHSVLTDQLWILDSSAVEVAPLENNGVNGAFHVEDATPPGADRQQQVLRGKYTVRVRTQKAHGYLYGLT